MTHCLISHLFGLFFIHVNLLLQSRISIDDRLKVFLNSLIFYLKLLFGLFLNLLLGFLYFNLGLCFSFIISSFLTFSASSAASSLSCASSSSLFFMSFASFSFNFVS